MERQQNIAIQEQEQLRRERELDSKVMIVITMMAMVTMVSTMMLRRGTELHSKVDTSSR